MYTYRQEQLILCLDKILQRNINTEAWNWLNDKVAQFSVNKNTSAFYMAFTAVSRYTGKATLNLTEFDLEQVSKIMNGFNISGYTADRLSRVWLLLHWDSKNKETYIKAISQLFKAAEMNELVALYGSLPVLAYPEEWVVQCSEGIRSNIGTVLEAIMCDNPYPAEYLNEPAWNQLVLKAFFTEKPIEKIIGLEDRANKALAYTLSDYAHERWSANRTFDLQLWRVVSKFIDKRIFPDIKKVFEEGNEKQKEAVALACYRSQYGPAKILLEKWPSFKSAIELNKLNWKNLSTAIVQ